LYPKLKGVLIMSELILWKNQEISKLKRDMQRLFNRFWYGFGVQMFPEEAGGISPIDLSETEDTLTIKAVFPGIKPEDMDISVTGDTLFIQGETREETVEGSADYQRVQRRSGSFSRTIALPCRIKVDEIKAVYKEGILKITMPKCEPDKARGVRIQVK
jgi:HSP20 family protein